MVVASPKGYVELCLFGCCGYGTVFDDDVEVVEVWYCGCCYGMLMMPWLCGKCVSSMVWEKGVLRERF